jgi:hypothetical protein
MLDNEEIDVRELQEKLDLVEAKLEELEEASGDSAEPEFEFVQISSSSKSFFLHWVTIDDTEFEACEDVDSVQKALQAFKQADEKRSSSQRSFLHGDMLVLMCNSAKEEDEDEDGGEVVTYPDSCYFIGMCIQTGDGDIHEEDPDPDIKLSEKFGGKHFVAWNTCGGGVREDYWKITVKACVDGESKDIDILTTTQPDPEEGTPPEPYGYIFKY